MNKRQLKVLLSVMPKNDIPYKLNCLFVDFDKSEVVACNGFMIIAVKCAHGLNGTGSVLIPRNVVEQVAKTKTKNTIRFSNAEISGDDFSFPFTPLQGTYPDYSKVIPPNEDLKKPGQFGFYQSKYIKVIEELEAAFEVSPLFHRPNKIGKPLKATFYAGSGERVIACVMPKSVRTSETYEAMKACI